MNEDDAEADDNATNEGQFVVDPGNVGLKLREKKVNAEKKKAKADARKKAVERANANGTAAPIFGKGPARKSSLKFADQQQNKQ